MSQALSIIVCIKDYLVKGIKFKVKNINTGSDSSPASWWRKLCKVTDQLFVCGDLPHNPAKFELMLAGWVDAGVTHIVDVRGEWSDEKKVSELQPQVVYSWLGTHDDGGLQDAEWFNVGVETICEALADPNAKVVVHCHMGVNRAPSMVFAALLELGFDIEGALDAIRDARPIAKILYAESAVAWFADRNGWGTSQRAEAQMRVRSWHVSNPADVGWIIRRIRLSELEVD